MTDVLLTLAGAAVLVGLVLVPAFQAFQRGRWIYLVVIIVLAPIGGVLWFLQRKALGRAGLTAPEKQLPS